MAADVGGLAQTAATVSESERAAIRSGFGSPSILFTTASRLVARKGLRELLRGWSLLEKRRQGDWLLLLIGTGPEEPELRALVADLGISRVLFNGHVNYDEIAKLYAVADVFVMPTLEDNWSLVVPEAMACGLPIICSIYNGCYPELVHDNVNGWVFDPLDPEDTFRVLDACLSNRGELKRMGEASRGIVASHTPARAATTILDAVRIAARDR
jgi:glycosyltransferase involved in cell wall biosynthesis